MLSCEGRAAGLLRRSELHELDPGLIGVEEIELDLAVAAYLGLGTVGALAVVAGERDDNVVHVRGAEGEVVHHAGLMKTRVGTGI